ncbi:uncharacterized protein LOC107614709 [Arachis ipaensis]|uniref:uncharacterized protein LOC107614709 n=1 Tax=Arachis ipaensis TaxID=130454 RepID=UPI0007AFACFD|nr:uncharacterized protein LOC107614709 [Arachis ipaensis]
MTLSELKTSILQKARLCGSKWVKKLFYKIPIAVVSAGVQYETFVIGADEDMLVLFHCRRSFLEVRIHELFAKLEDGFDSSGASAPNPQSMSVGGASTSMPVVAAGCLLAGPPPPPSPPPVAARSLGLIPGLFGEGEPDHIENAMRDDDLDDEPDNILGDSKEDTLSTSPARCGPSGSGSAQQPPHFSTLNVEAIGLHPDIDPTSGRHGLYEENPSRDFQIGQSFQTKEEAVLSVKDYSICRGFSIG